MHENPCLLTCHKCIHARPTKYQVGTFSIETCLWDVYSKVTTFQTLREHFSTHAANTNHHGGFTQNEVMPDADLYKFFIKMCTMHIILAINAYFGDISYKNVPEWLGQWNKLWNVLIWVNEPISAAMPEWGNVCADLKFSMVCVFLCLKTCLSVFLTVDYISAATFGVSTYILRQKLWFVTKFFLNGRENSSQPSCMSKCIIV